MDRRLELVSILILGTLLYLNIPSAEAKLRSLSLPRQLKECYYRTQNYTIENFVGGQYCWLCEASVRSQIKGAPKPLKPEQYSYYRSLYTKIDPTSKLGARGKRQASRCLRKEYRMLTDDERNRFHRAVNALKTDTTVEPNKFDALSLFHTGVATFVAHGGPGFPGWHRIYLMLFEAALQEVDPTVCVPYWDSTMDSALDNPDQSYIWSNDFFGGHDGEVLSGVFADWRTPEGMNLRRAVGRDGQLFTRESIEAIMSRNTYEEILMPDEDPQYNLEFHHAGTHVFVGGDMERLDTAAFDIVFFLHHAFVDYIWEMFRSKMRNSGLDPERYPTHPDLSDYHLPTSPMGFGNITHAEGYLDAIKDSYDYAPAPECSAQNPDCGSKYLWCNTTVARCVPINPADPPIVGPHPEHCPFSRPQSYQNSFCINNVCDVNQWVWVPVKIVAQRPPEFKGYASYPVEKGKVSRLEDIYEPARYLDTRQFIKPDKKIPKGYDHCEVKDGVGKIFVSSQGVTYDGTYKESAIIDQRLATSIGVTFIAVKDPGAAGATQVILRAHDQCGRICHTACKIPGSNPTRYEACSGVVEVTSAYPRQYGQTYAEATLHVYDYASNSDCPAFNTDDFFMTFYCDYRDHLPWVEKPAVSPLPVVPRPSPVVVQPPATTSGQCRLSSQCTINQPCYKSSASDLLHHNNHDNHRSHHSTSSRQCDTYMEMHSCQGNCRRYAVCIYGVYWPRLCPAGTHFDQVMGKCVRGRCRNRPSNLPNIQPSVQGGSHGNVHGGQGGHGSAHGGQGGQGGQGGTANRFGSNAGYYSRLMNRFGLGKR